MPECHDSLDAPIHVWDKVHSTLDLKWLLLKPKKLNSKLIEYLQKAWDKIYEEYIKEFGFNETFIEIKEKELELTKLRIEFLLTKDRSLLTWIEIAEIDLQEVQKSVGKAGLMESKIAIENKFKFQINMQSTTIREFYSYLKYLK